MDITISTLLELTEYMAKRLGIFTTALGWTDFTTVDGPLYEAAIDAVLDLGVDDIATVTDYRALRASGEFYAWAEVVNNAGALYDFEADGASYKRGQLQAMAQSSLANAYNKAIALGVDVDGSEEAAEIVVVGVEWADF